MRQKTLERIRNNIARAMMLLDLSDTELQLGHALLIRIDELLGTPTE